MRVIGIDQIREILPDVDLIAEIEQGFVAYSDGRAVVPPVGELLLKDPPGDVHIKYGYIEGDDYYVIKIASGFYQNASLGLPSSNGMMLVFSQQSGAPVAILADEGYLTDIRTAVAGAIAAKYLAPSRIDCIGIVGTGIQARLQLEYLRDVTDCRTVKVWGRDSDKIKDYIAAVNPMGFEVTGVTEPNALLEDCQLIVTTTPSEVPLLNDSAALQPGTHITAMGSDTHSKQEIGAEFLSCANVVVADSIAQCLERGEIHQALKAGALQRDEIAELGNIIAGRVPGREDDAQITIADLTGVAVQDIQISKAVYERSA